MANKSLIPMFSIADIAKRIDEFAEAKVQKSIETLHYVGEEFVNRARSIRTYKDRTGNLRSSIGYVVLFNLKGLLDLVVSERRCGYGGSGFTRSHCG